MGRHAALSGAVVILLLIAGCGAFPQVKPSSSAEPAVGRAGGATAVVPPVGRRLDGPLDGRTGAYLTVASAAAEMDLRLVELTGLLYRITTPAGSGLAPRVTGSGGAVRLALAPTGDDGPDRVLILLNRHVRWHLRLTAGAGEQHLDLVDGRLAGVNLAGGAGSVSLRLPEPHGTVPIRLSGGVGEVRVGAPPGVPVRVRLRRGAMAVRLPWTAQVPVPSGTVLMPAGWPAATHRYLLDLRGDVGTFDLSG